MRHVSITHERTFHFNVCLDKYDWLSDPDVCGGLHYYLANRTIWGHHDFGGEGIVINNFGSLDEITLIEQTWGHRHSTIDKLLA